MKKLASLAAPLPVVLAASLCCMSVAQAQSAGVKAASEGQAAHEGKTALSATPAAPPAAGTLPQVTITDRGAPTVSAKELERKTPRNLRDALEDVTSVNFIGTGGGQLGDIEIRGMGGMSGTMGTGSNRVQMEVDGMEISQAFNFGHNMRFGREYFDPSDLKSVSVSKGPGANGFAGNVQFRTKDPEDYLQPGQRFGGEARAGYRGDETNRHAGVTLAGRLGDGSSALISYNRRDYRELKNKGGVAATGSARTRSNPLDAVSNSLNGKWLFQPNRQHLLTLGFQHFDTDRDTNLLSGLTTSTRRGVTTQVRASTNSQKNQRNALSLRHDLDMLTAMFDAATWQLSLQHTKSEGLNFTDSLITTAATGQSRVQQAYSNNDFTVKSVALRADFDKRLEQGGLRHGISYGLRLQHSETDMNSPRASGTPGSTPNFTNQKFFSKTKQWQMRLHVADRVQLGQSGWSVTPALNVTHIHIKPQSIGSQTAPGSDRKYSRTVAGGSLRLDWQLTPQQLLALNLSHATRLPGYGEVGAQSYGHWATRPNPDLRPETAQGLELSWSSRSEVGHQKTAIFHNRYRNLIDVDCGPNYSASYCTIYNQKGRSTAHGLEWDGVLHLSALGLPRGLSVGGGLSLVKGKDGDGDPRGRIDPYNGYLSLRHDSPDDTWGFDLRVRFAAAKKASDLPTGVNPLPGWGATNLTAYYSPAKNVTLSGGIYNVFDKQYAVWARARGQSNYARFTEAGRHFGVHLRYQF